MYFYVSRGKVWVIYRLKIVEEFGNGAKRTDLLSITFQIFFSLYNNIIGLITGHTVGYDNTFELRWQIYMILS